jgi:CHAT domain-containing protein
VATACSKQNLIDAEYALRTAMGVEALAATRSLILKKDIQKRSTISKAAKPSSTGIEKAIQQSTKLLLPTQISSKLEGLKHLFIIPEFNISQFPFHVLKPYSSGGYLVDSLSYSFVPHLCNFGAFAMENNARIGNKNSLKVNNPLVVGNPTYSNVTEFDLPKLPGAEVEATLVGDILGTYPLIGAQAGKSQVVSAAQKADLLYFATHGHFDEARMLDGSFLAFAPDSSSNSGFLTAREIQTLNLPAKMAILSACQTGFGKVFSGGFHGIGRAFYKAGVNFNIISLWSVDDNATKELMARFMVKMMQPEYFFPASQLQQAIIATKSKYPNPAYWAAFSVFGFTN